MTNILDVLKGTTVAEIVKQRDELVKQSLQITREIETLAHVISAVKILTHEPVGFLLSGTPSVDLMKATTAVSFHIQNQPETLPAVAEWPAQLTPKESALAIAHTEADFIAEMKDEVESLSNPEPVCESFNTTMENLPSVEITDGSKSQKRAKRYGIDPAFEVLPVDTFDMESVSMERKVRTYLEAAGSASVMSIASAFGLPNAKTLKRMLESDPAYERDSRGFWSIKK